MAGEDRPEGPGRRAVAPKQPVLDVRQGKGDAADAQDRAVEEAPMPAKVAAQAFLSHSIEHARIVEVRPERAAVCVGRKLLAANAVKGLSCPGIAGPRALKEPDARV